jgi:FkbM family methyltransferase
MFVQDFYIDMSALELSRQLHPSASPSLSIGYSKGVHGLVGHHGTRSLFPVIGYLSRRFHGANGGLLQRILKVVALQVVPRLPSAEYPYVDAFGNRRRADVSDHMELLGFLGLFDQLPSSVTRAVKHGEWCIDIGANVGLLSGELCHLVGPSGRVWAIEPVARNIARLQQLRDDNGLDQLRVVEGALSSTTGSASIRLPRDGRSGWASLSKSWDVESTRDVATWRLDDLVGEEREGANVSFLKIDVEGAEPEVVEGAERTLKTMRPLVMCEFNDVLLQDAGASAQQLLATFEALGYRPFGRSLRDARLLRGRIRNLVLKYG